MDPASFCLLFSRVALKRHLPNRVFYSPVWVAIGLLEGRRKEDFVYTLGIKINLLFIEKPMSLATAECDRDFFFWLRKIHQVSLPIGQF
jgi:hypothetical protein